MMIIWFLFFLFLLRSRYSCLAKHAIWFVIDVMVFRWLGMSLLAALFAEVVCVFSYFAVYFATASRGNARLVIVILLSVVTFFLFLQGIR